ncbi:MAG TPA: glycosyltransferase family 39 protein [Anaerolineae bacterium]
MSKDYHPETIIRLTAMALAAVGFALRLYALGSESLWFDELLQLDIAQQSLSTFLPELRHYAAAPLDYIISHFWIGLGRGDVWVRLPAVVVGTLTLPLAYQLGRQLLGRSAGPSLGLVLMALLAFSPFHVRYSQETRPYALVVLGVTLTAYALWQLRRTGRWQYIVPLQVGVLIFSLAHLFATVIFAPLLVFITADWLVSRPRNHGTMTLLALLGTGAVALIILLSMGWASAFYYSTREFGKAVVEPEKFTVEAAEKPNQGTGPQVGWTLIQKDILGPLGAGDSATSLWLFNGIAGLGLFYLLVEGRYRLSLLLVLWLSLPIMLIVAFLVFRGTFFASRYIIATLPAYLILLAAGLLALPRWLRCAQPRWLSFGAFLLLAGLVWADLTGELQQLYREHTNEDWRLVALFLRQNAGPDDAILAVNTEFTLNWYYPPVTAAANTFDTLEAVQNSVARAERSWVILSFFSTFLEDEFLKIRAWLSEQGAVQLRLDPVITVYYLGHNVPPPQLLEEIRSFALPPDHALYASLARENRRNPAVARRYYELAIEIAPDEETRAAYRAALELLVR